MSPRVPDRSVATIAAVATAAGLGAVGIVRVSGPLARDILGAMVADWPATYPGHRLRVSRIREPGGALVDEALVVLMPGPHSYTGEDVVEFQCHGGPIVLQRVLDAALALGARAARPGEFTERAFLNGRMDLTQAEAVADLVHATSLSAHRLAMEHLEGKLGQHIRGLLEELTVAVVLVEAAIDFSHEEHVYQIERQEVLQRVSRVQERLEALRRGFDEGRRQREGLRMVILGPPNAGKSTLFNALYGSSRAIVTEIAGTTRDYLEEQLDLGGVCIRLVDTAGLRQTEDRVESIGIARSQELGAAAEVVVWVLDQSTALLAEHRETLKTLAGGAHKRLVVVANKSDLPCALKAGERPWLESLAPVLDTALGQATDGAVDVNSGLEPLRQCLRSVGLEMTAAREGVLLSRARHLHAVLQAEEALGRARQALEAQWEHELVAIDLREALDALGDIVGRVSTDDILARIFGEFCVGK